MLCLNQDALKDKYVILDGAATFGDKMRNDSLTNTFEPALLVRDGETVLYYGQELHADPIDERAGDCYIFENCFKVEAISYYYKLGAKQESRSRLDRIDGCSVSFMAPVHYVTDPEVYQTVFLDPFSGTDMSHLYPYHILVKHDWDHIEEYYLDGMSTFIGFSLEAPEDRQVCLVREYEGRYTAKFISGTELLKECRPDNYIALISIPDCENNPCPVFDIDDSALPEGFYSELIVLDAMEIEFIYVFINTHLGKIYHISETEYREFEMPFNKGIYGYSPSGIGPLDPIPHWYGRRCIRYARSRFRFDSDLQSKELPDTLVEGIHFIIDSDDDPAYATGQHSVLWEMYARVHRDLSE